MALIEEDMSFTLTPKYHNLYVAKKKVFSARGSWQQQQSVHVALTHKYQNKIKDKERKKKK